MEIIEIIKETTKFSEGANKELSYIFIIPTIIMVIAAIRIIHTYKRKTKQVSVYETNSHNEITNQSLYEYFSK